MSTAYWTGDHADLDAKAGAENHNASGVHLCCRQYAENVYCVSPVATLGLGAPTKAILKCDPGIDLSVYYPSFVEKTLSQIRTMREVVANHWYDPSDVI